MSENSSSDSAAPAEPLPPRKGVSAWAVVVFLALLGALLVINQVAATSGPPIRWIENDLDAALARLSDPGHRVFLYLYEPNDPVHARNEREVFRQRWARTPLTRVVCCRIALGSDATSNRLRLEFNYQGKPLFLILTKSRVVTSRTEGAVTEKEFYTYVTEPANRARSIGP